MSADDRPIIVAFDGSDEAKAAVTAAAGLFGERQLVIVSVWEPGLAVAMATMRDPDAFGSASMLPAADDVVAVDRAQAEHAESTAQAGADLARGLGATAQALAEPDSSDVADTIMTIADERDAAALVVGRRGLGVVKSKLLGSTSQRLLHDSRRPVVVVRSPE